MHPTTDAFFHHPHLSWLSPLLLAIQSPSLIITLHSDSTFPVETGKSMDILLFLVFLRSLTFVVGLIVRKWLDRDGILCLWNLE